MLERIWPHGPKEDLDSVESALRQLDGKDPSSQAFRYARTVKGDRPLKGIRHMNVQQLSDVLEGVANLLDGCHTGICHYLEVKQEFSEDME